MIGVYLTRIQRWGRRTRRTLASNARHALPPNPSGSGAMTTRKAPR